MTHPGEPVAGPVLSSLAVADQESCDHKSTEGKEEGDDEGCEQVFHGR